VVLLVLVLLAVPVFITQATIGPNWRHAYEQERKRSDGLKMDARSEMLAHSKTIAERDAAITELQKTRQDKKMELDRLTGQLIGERTRTAGLQNDLNRLATEVAGLKAEAQTFNKRNEMLASELDAARLDIASLNKELLRVSDLLKQSEAEKDRLDKTVRVQVERVRSLEEELDQLRATGAVAKATTGKDTVAIPDQPIIGTITTVKGDYASINIGSAQGIKRNMPLIIYRGDQLVARLRVDEVDSVEAAGIILDRQLDPIPGDKVTTRLLK
jgi:predicted RNase H-like nuclease (RuvC/YqgF family)